MAQPNYFITKEDDKSFWIQPQDNPEASPLRVAKTEGTQPLYDRIRASAIKEQPDPKVSVEQEVDAASHGEPRPIMTRDNPASEDLSRSLDSVSTSAATAASAKPASAEGQPASGPPAAGGTTPTSLPNQAVGMVMEGFGKEKKALEEGNKDVQKAYKEGLKNVATYVGHLDAVNIAQDEAAKREAQANQLKEEALNKKMTSLKEAREDYAKNEIDPKKLWNNMGTWNKALAGLAIVMGGVGQAMTKSNVNYGLKAIDDAIDLDVKAQTAKRETLKTKVNMAESDVQDSRQSIHDARERFMFEKQVRYDQLARYLAKLEAQNKGTDLAAKAAEMRTMFEMKSAELDQKMGQMFLSTLPNPLSLKEEQIKAAGFHNQMQQAYNVVQELQTKGFTGTKMKPGFEFMKSQDRKKMEAAYRGFIEANIMAEGGRYTAERIKAAEDIFMPKFNDSKEVLQQKAEAMQNAMQRVRSQAGQAILFQPDLSNSRVPTGFKRQ